MKIEISSYENGRLLCRFKTKLDLKSAVRVLTYHRPTETYDIIKINDLIGIKCQ